MRMKIYADRYYLPQNIPHCSMLHPFWGHLPVLGNAEIEGNRCARYLREGHEIFELVGLRDAEVAVLPFHWEQAVPEAIENRGDLALFRRDPDAVRAGVSSARRLAEELAEAAGREGVPLVVFLMHDSEKMTVPLENSFSFRTSIFRSELGAYEFAWPVWVRDEVETLFGGELPVRRKKARPVVGFCGLNPYEPESASGWRGRLRALAGPLRRAEVREVLRTEPQTYLARARALAALSRSRAVQTNFVFRHNWCNGAFATGVDLPLYQKSRAEYVRNIFESDYVLCARGEGNYSIRLYETLSCGRIPVFVNTDCALPYEGWIDWKRFSVWVEEGELEHVAERVLEFHERLSPREFEEMQRACRRLWLKWLSPEGFFGNFYRHFGGQPSSSPPPSQASGAAV
jgi:hypothetical protein